MFDQITPAVKRLLIITIGIHVFFGAILSLPARNFILEQFAFFNPFLPNNPDPWSPLFKPWQPVTYIFLHGGWGHLFGNMFALFIFGPALEAYMGPRKFMIYYLLTGIGAALLNSGLHFYELSRISPDSNLYADMVGIPMIGASGSIFGLLVAFGVLFPNVELMLLFFPFPIKAKYFVMLYGFYELYAGTAGVSPGVAHFAHIGGLITGFILLKFFNFDRRSYY